MMMLNSARDYDCAIDKNKTFFEGLLGQIKEESELCKKLEIAYNAVYFADTASTSYYSSDLLEDVFCQLAQEHTIPLSREFKRDSVLHIATEVYHSGGHTRVIERWMESSESREEHSLLLTKAAIEALPEQLLHNIKEKNGALIELSDDLSPLEKALQLREIASAYDKIILHVHMHDVIPIIAFASPDFKRPIFFFNHADHRFWMGISIADCVVNFREFGLSLSKKWRGVEDNFILPLLNNTAKPVVCGNVTALKEELGLPLDRKIIFSAGSAFKYEALLNLNFKTYIDEVLRSRDDVFFVAIGPNLKNNPDWKMLDRTKSKLLEVVPFSSFLNYLSCADIVIDSFPMSGGVALMDAVSLKKPVLSLLCPTGQADYIEKSSAYCKTIEDLIAKTYLFLDNETLKEGNISEVSQLSYAEHDRDEWRKKKNELFSNYKTHRVHRFQSVCKDAFDMLDYFLHRSSIIVTMRLDIPYILKIYTHRLAGKLKMKFLFFKP